MRLFRRKRIGIALSGGAARALCHIGVLEILDELGVEISAVSGTSMGAIIGAFYALGINIKEMEEYIYSTNWKEYLLFSNITMNRFGVINSRKADRALDALFGDKTFDDCKRDFCCVAVDIEKREKVVFNSGKLKDAVRASISIPGIFSTMSIGDRILVDGGVIEPLPTEAIKTLGVNFIIASSVNLDKEDKPLDVSFTGDEDNLAQEERSSSKIGGALLKSRKEKVVKKKPSLFYILDASLHIIHREMTEKYLKSADIVIEPRVGDFGFFDFVRSKEIIERGRKAAIEKIPEIEKKLGRKLFSQLVKV
ncbi:MAG: patatin-like phospholipase family protein [Actinobacteria bacterium]|nr:patatin-like phospholipase family protein [Actinomycetota bacterium]